MHLCRQTSRTFRTFCGLWKRCSRSSFPWYLILGRHVVYHKLPFHLHTQWSSSCHSSNGFWLKKPGKSQWPSLHTQSLSLENWAHNSSLMFCHHSSISGAQYSFWNLWKVEADMNSSPRCFAKFSIFEKLFPDVRTKAAAWRLFDTMPFTSPDIQNLPFCPVGQFHCITAKVHDRECSYVVQWMYPEYLHGPANCCNNKSNKQITYISLI